MGRTRASAPLASTVAPSLTGQQLARPLMTVVSDVMINDYFQLSRTEFTSLHRKLLSMRCYPPSTARLWVPLLSISPARIAFRMIFSYEQHEFTIHSILSVCAAPTTFPTTTSLNCADVYPVFGLTFAQFQEANPQVGLIHRTHNYLLLCLSFKYSAYLHRRASAILS